MKRALSSKDWLGKSSAGLILGFLLALGAGGLFKVLGGVGDTFFSTKGQLAMWLVPPVWLGVLSFVYFFSSGLRAWAWLLGANALALGFWWLLWKGGAA